METIYLKCRSPIMTFVDPKTKFMIPRGKIVKLTGSITKTMQRWIRRGGLKKVEEALYLKQQGAEPKEAVEKKEAVPQATQEPEASPSKEKSADKVKESEEKQEANKTGRKSKKNKK